MMTDDEFLREHFRIIPVVLPPAKKAVDTEPEAEPLDPYDGPGDNEDIEDSDDLDWVTDFRRDHGLRVDEAEPMSKGDVPGHDFHGNQYSQVASQILDTLHSRDKGYFIDELLQTTGLKTREAMPVLNKLWEKGVVVGTEVDDKGNGTWHAAHDTVEEAKKKAGLSQ